MKKRKKIISIFLIITVCFSIFVFDTKISNADTSYSEVTSSTNIDSKYSFSPRFIDGVSYLEGFGGYSYESDLSRTTTKNSNGTYNVEYYDKNKFYPIRLTRNNEGKIGVWYRNIGTYRGDMLDLKITINEYSDIRDNWTVKSTQGDLICYPTIMFSKNKIGINPTSFSIKNTKYKFELYNKNGEFVNVNMHWNILDIDDAQYVQSDDIYHSYIDNSNWLQVSGNKIYSAYGKDSNSDEKKAMATILLDNKSSFILGFSATQYDEDDFNKKKVTKTWHTVEISGDSLAPFTTPKPIKSASSVVHKGDNIIYNINFIVPQQPNDYLYNKFVVNDKLPNGVKYKSYEITNDAGENATDLFNINCNGQNFTATANKLKDSKFYYKSYNIKINCVADSNYDFSIGNDGSKTVINNIATITSKAGSRAEESQNSNTASTEVKFKLTTSTDGHGSITNSINNISGGENKTITYTPNIGYEVSTINIDNKNIAINNANKKSYTFSNIHDHHKIHVTFKPTIDNKITITKKIPKNDLKSAYGNPVGIFKCIGTDLNGDTHEYYEAVELTKDDLNGDYYTKTVTFNNLVAGSYKVTEVDTSRYDLTSVIANSGATSSNNILNCDLINNKEAKGTFTNSLTKFNLWSHSNIKINQFK